LNARDAADRGADIRTRAEVVAAERSHDEWRVGYREDGRLLEVGARVLVNAAGPWAGEIASLALGVPQAPIRLVRGSHHVVRRHPPHGSAYILQNRDGRVVFLIPWDDAFTLVGTTDGDNEGNAARPAIPTSERDYLLAAANLYLAEPLTTADI